MSSPVMEAVRSALGARWEGSSLKANCPVHGGEHLFVQPPDRDGIPTFGCRKGAPWPDLRTALLGEGVPAAALRGVPRDTREPEPLPDLLPLLETYPRRLLSPEGQPFLDFLAGLGVRGRTLRAEHLGLVRYKGAERITWPVFNRFGEVVQVRFWNPFADKVHRKLWLRGRGARHLFGVQHLEDVDQDEPVLWCEGESDYLSAAARGVRAVGVTGGAGTVPEDLSAFAGRPVVVCFDNDDAGRAGARKSARALVEAGATVWIADISQHVPDPGGDLADWLVRGNGSGRRLREWMEKVAADHPVSLADLDTADEHFEDRVQTRLDNLRADRAARKLLAQEEAAGLWPGFADGTLADFLAEPRDPTPWVIEGLLRRGHKAVLTAQFKVGKTTLLGNVVRSLADGELLFGRFPVAPSAGRLAVFDFELTPEDAADMYERLAVQNADRVLVTSLRGTGFSLANDVHAELTVDYLRRNAARVWVIDPFSRAMRGFGSENSNDEVSDFLGCVDRIAAEAELDAVIISAHTGRTEQAVGAERARGATKIDDDPDARWIYSKDEAGTRFFRAEGRNRVGCAEIALAYDPERELLVAENTSRQDSRLRDKGLAAARIVAGKPGIKATELQALMPGSDPKTKRPAIAYAVGQGWITEEDGPKHSKVYQPGPEAPETRLSL